MYLTLHDKQMKNYLFYIINIAFSIIFGNKLEPTGKRQLQGAQKYE